VCQALYLILQINQSMSSQLIYIYNQTLGQRGRHVVFEKSITCPKRNFVVWISVVKSYKVFVYKSEVVPELQALWFTQSNSSMQFSGLELFE
jgi:hypothetical protein